MDVYIYTRCGVLWPGVDAIEMRQGTAQNIKFNFFDSAMTTLCLPNILHTNYVSLFVINDNGPRFIDLDTDLGYKTSMISEEIHSMVDTFSVMFAHMPMDIIVQNSAPIVKKDWTWWKRNLTYPLAKLDIFVVGETEKARYRARGLVETQYTFQGVAVQGVEPTITVKAKGEWVAATEAVQDATNNRDLYHNGVLVRINGMQVITTTVKLIQQQRSGDGGKQRGLFMLLLLDVEIAPQHLQDVSDFLKEHLQPKFIDALVEHLSALEDVKEMLEMQYTMHRFSSTASLKYAAKNVLQSKVPLRMAEMAQRRKAMPAQPLGEDGGDTYFDKLLRATEAAVKRSEVTKQGAAAIAAKKRDADAAAAAGETTPIAGRSIVK
jgi:hypothetical protein